MSTTKKSGPFDLHTFIVQSCLIDPQYDQNGWQFLPANKPGDLMYDNMQNAFAMAMELADAPLYPEIVKDIHRVMTRGISDFEVHNASGQYRTYNVQIANRLCPDPKQLNMLMHERWFPRVERELAKHDGTPAHALQIAMAAHHAFEYIHPFIDGNGRSGRLMLNHLLKRMNQECVTVWYKRRFEYYNAIEKFVAECVDDYLGATI